jgi:hypothetical protein
MKLPEISENPTLKDTLSYVASLAQATLEGHYEQETIREVSKFTNQMVRLHDQQLQRAKYITAAHNRGIGSEAQRLLSGGDIDEGKKSRRKS